MVRFLRIFCPVPNADTRHWWLVGSVGAVMPVLFAGIMSAAETTATPPVPPRLAVVISIDQCRADYLDRFAPSFGPGGFRRMLNEGADYTACHYEHATTKTAVGHATILTGAYPSVHGVIANDWLEGNDWHSVNAVEDADAPIVGGPSPKGRSPRRLLAATLGEVLKQHFGDAARVCSIANKDRAAILMGGHRTDGTYWLGDNDRFVSSRYFFPDGRLPAWVDAYNDAHPLSRYFGRTWDRLLPPEEYQRVQGPDDAQGEFAGLGLGRTFPRTIDGGEATIGPRFSEAFDRSPFALEIIANFARALVQNEQLGADDVPDLLCIGFSQIDAIGHAYGPDSHELMDSFVRLDRLVAQLLSFLDERVGSGRYVVVVTGDHGVAPTPEHLHASHPEITGARVDLRPIDQVVNAALIEAFGPDPEGRAWSARDNSGYRLRTTTLQARHVSREDAANVVKAALLKRPEIAAAFTARDLEDAPDTGDSMATLFRHSQHRERSQDVVFALQRWDIDRLKTGSTHGSPYEYDTHVPLLWFGAGITPGRHDERVGMTDLAPTLAGILGIPPPPQANGHRLF